MNRILSIVGFLFLCTATLPAQLSPGTSAVPDSPGAVVHPHLSISELARSNRWKEVAELAGETHRKQPDDPTPLYWLGISRLKLHEPVGSVQAFRSAGRLPVAFRHGHQSGNHL